MNFDEEDIQIKEIMRSVTIKNPPRPLVEKFEAEVMERLAKPAVFLAPSWLMILALALTGMAALYFISFKSVQPADVSLENKSAAVIQSSQTPAPASGKMDAPEIDPLAQEQIAHDVLLLDLLGEEISLDVLNQMETDLDFFSQSLPVPSQA